MVNVKEAVVLSAGVSRRLQNLSNEPKPLLKIMGRHLIRYILETLLLSGLNRFTIVVPTAWRDRFREVINDLEGAEICFISNSEVERENGYSFYLSKDCVVSNYFLLTMGDHIYVPTIVNRLIKELSINNEADVIVGADSSPKYVSIDEATKILANSDGKVIREGKDLGRFNYVDIGVFIMSRKVFKVAEVLVGSRYVVKLTDVINEAVRRRLKVVIADVNGMPWTEIDTPTDFKELINGRRRVVLNEVIRYLGGSYEAL